MKKNIFTPVITFLSAKGGIGKTILIINLAYLLRKDGYKVLIIDTNFKFPTVDLLLGKTKKITAEDLLKESKSLIQRVQYSDEDIYFLSFFKAFKIKEELKELDNIISALDELRKDFDFILIDTSTCINERFIQLVIHSDKNILIVSPEIASVSNSYLLIKYLLSRTSADIYLLINKTDSEREANDIYKDLESLSYRTLKIKLNYLGFIHFENALFNFSKYESLYIKEFPLSRFSKDLERIKNKILEGAR
jgi:flagellar biosynthesis protein FlhG